MTVRIEWEGTPGRKLEGANLHINPHVVLELATLNEDEPYGWGVWGVRVDGVLYREPRDLAPEPLSAGPTLDYVEAACAAAAADWEPSDDQLYNGFGREGGIPYDTTPDGPNAPDRSL